MQQNLKGCKVAVMGGDARELVLVEELASSGARVNVVGLPVKSSTGRVVKCRAPEECLIDINAVILPVPGINEKGLIYCPLLEEPLALTGELLAKIPDGVPVFVGVARPLLNQMASRKGVRLIELMKLDEVAILNSIPSAEGAVQMAMEMLPVTIHGSSACVLGFGRTGVTLARLLGVMGARTSVVARRPEHLARITEMNLIPVPFDLMPDYLGDADVIFNTVPSLVLTGEVLEKVSSEAVIIDLASAPGGTDFRRAESLGIKAVLAPGLPGKVAPKTAGRNLARVITRLLVEEMAGS
jgi:dipicolinate synthase subunit A